MKYKMSVVLMLALVAVLVAQPVSADQWLFQEDYVNFPVGDGQVVGLGDFNSDGLQDVAMGTSTQLLYFLQNSDGNLANPVAYFLVSQPWSMAVGDFNNDGRSDIVTTNYSRDSSSDVISVYLQGTEGNLVGQITFYETYDSPDAVAVGDVNGDGLDDIAVSHWDAGNIGVFTQTPAGILNPMVTYASPQAGYDDIEIADINNDGKNDVIKMNGLGEYPSLSVYIQDANGTLAPEVTYPLTYCSLFSYCLGHGIGTGDVTSDGLTDIVLGFSYGGNTLASEIAVFAQAPNGSLQNPTFYPAASVPEPVEIADVNSDSLADVVTVHGSLRQVSVYLQQSGILSPYSTYYSIPTANHYKPQGLDVGDINNDTLPDLVMANNIFGLVVLYHTESTPPTISVKAEKEDLTDYIPGTWTNQTVTVKYTCSDTESGIASCPANQVFSADGITETIGTATDNAGNSASASFGPIQIDKTPPALFIGVSPNPVMLNGNAEMLTNAVDTLSGIKPGSMPCLNIDTSSVGIKSTTCYVSDNAGNKTTSEATYQVIYDFDGFLSPVIDCTNNTCNVNSLSTFKPGSSVPLKFQLKDADGSAVQAASAPLWLTPTSFASLPISLPDDYGFQVSSSTYEWRKNHQNYVYEWSTKDLPDRSIWLVGVKLDDGMTYHVFVALAK